MTGFWFGSSLGLASGVTIGVALTCIFAATRVTEAEAEAQHWRDIAEDKQRLRLTWNSEARR